LPWSAIGRGSGNQRWLKALKWAGFRGATFHQKEGSPFTFTDGVMILADLERRVRKKDLLSKVVSSTEASLLIEDGMTIACSGFTPAGYP